MQVHKWLSLAPGVTLGHSHIYFSVHPQLGKLFSKQFSLTFQETKPGLDTFHNSNKVTINVEIKSLRGKGLGEDCSGLKFGITHNVYALFCSTEWAGTFHKPHFSLTYTCILLCTTCCNLTNLAYGYIYWPFSINSCACVNGSYQATSPTVWPGNKTSISLCSFHKFWFVQLRQLHNSHRPPNCDEDTFSNQTLN